MQIRSSWQSLEKLIWIELVILPLEVAYSFFFECSNPPELADTYKSGVDLNLLYFIFACSFSRLYKLASPWLHYGNAPFHLAIFTTTVYLASVCRGPGVRDYNAFDVKKRLFTLLLVWKTSTRFE